MQNADAFVLFSKHENFPCVIPEALCCGLPVVAANVGGIAEAIHTNNGVVVNSEDIVMLANALAKIMQNSSNFLNETIAKDAQRKYSNTVIGNQFIQLYKKMM
jgi:glycosyltransferase involved in cell wall biosynthesis